MMATMCHLNVAMVWWGKPILLHVLTLRDRQVRECIAVRSNHPSGIWTHVQDWRVSAWPLLNKLGSEEGLLEVKMSTSQMELARDVWIWMTTNCEKHWRLSKLNHPKGRATPPVGLPQGNVKAPGAVWRECPTMRKKVPGGRRYGGIVSPHGDQ